MFRSLVILFLVVTTASSAGAQSVDGVIAQLREITNASVRDWKFEPADIPGAEKPDFDDSAWRTGSPELEWGHQPIAWLRKTVVVPERIGGIPVAGSKIVFRAAVDDDGECHVNGELKQKFHWGDCNVVLTENAQPGQKFVIALKGMNGGGPGRLLSAELRFSALEEMRPQIARVIGELEAGKRLIEFEKDQAAQESYRNALDRAAAALSTASLGRGDKQAFLDSIANGLKELEPLSRAMKEYTVHLIGHAHIDMNWLWLWPETVDVCKNTFSTVLKLMDEFPDFRFSQSQASTYIAVEEAAPEIFRQIHRRVKEGRWEITGGTWVEGDMNMASGESIVRQVLYANRYFKEKFDVEPQICWEPDTFGHAWTVPQILAKSGIKYYYFCRCGKGEPVFWWEAPDGSRVLAYNRGGYGDSISDGIMDAPLDCSKRYGVNDGMVVYGVGDHGGGPTREDIRRAIELQGRAVYPDVKFDTTEGFYESLLAQKKDYPVIRDELNFTFEGCYTTHSDIKKMNRVLENLLPAAEMFSALARPFGFSYPKKGFVDAWRNTCFNQFHDIFDGSAIHGAYDYSRDLFNKAYGIGDTALKRSVGLIAGEIDTSGAGIPVVVFNPLSWKRTDVVRMDVPESLQGKYVAVNDARGREMRAGVIEGQLIFTARDVPSVGYKVFYLAEKAPFSTLGGIDSIANEFFEVHVDHDTGAVIDVYDKKDGRHVLAEPGGVLQILQESPRHMSAWTIGQIAKTESASVESVEVISQAPVAVLRVKHRYNNSAFTQDIILYPGVPRIDFRMTADWFERGEPSKGGPMLKVAFPVNVPDGKATFEIPFGSIERPADGHEVPAQKWIDVSNKDYGVSLLNDSKYGHDVSGSTMRLTLLRASYDPDPIPDRGRHMITYSLYPHSGDWRQADTVRRGYELNNPLIPLVTSSHAARLPKEHSFLTIEPSNVIVTALKQAEDSDDLILRFYECEGTPGTATISFATRVSEVREADLMERPLKNRTIPVKGGRIKVPFGKWEIKTLEIKR